MPRPARRDLTACGLAMLACVATGLAQAELGGNTGIARDVAAASWAARVDADLVARQRLDADLDALARREDDARQNLVREVRALYRLTRPGAAPVAAGFDALRAHVARIKRLERLASTQAATLANLTDTRARLRGERARLDAVLADKRANQGGLDAQRVAIATPGVGTTMPAASGPDEPFYGLRLVDGPPLDTFEARKGELMSPVTGEVRVIDARRDGSGPGLEFQTAAGTPVRTVAAGRVAFADRRSNYGRLVMLDHGDDYYTVYAGLGDVDVMVGDDLSEGARLGVVGDDGVPPALYFEVRRGDRALSPRAWLGF